MKFEIVEKVSAKTGNPYYVLRLHFDVNGKDVSLDMFTGNQTDAILALYRACGKEVTTK